MQKLDKETAYAKVNLALHIRGKLPNGYHDLETIFVFSDDGDHLSVSRAAKLKLNIDGRFAKDLAGDAPQDNLVMRAAALLQRTCACTKGAHLHLTKSLPIASGIGGGSADAAAAMRLLNRYWQLGLSLDELAAIAAPLGADIPACIYSQTSIGKGIGTDIHIVNDDVLKDKILLLVNPLQSVSTQAIFANWNGIDKGALHIPDGGNLLSAAIAGRNDLTNSAMVECPAIGSLISILREGKAMMARMSGSGATCFAIYDDMAHAEKAALAIKSITPKYWMMLSGFRTAN